MKSLFNEFSSLSKEIFGVDLFSVTSELTEVLPTDIITHKDYIKFRYQTGVSNKSNVKIDLLPGDILSVTVEKDSTIKLVDGEVLVNKELHSSSKVRKYRISRKTYDLDKVDAKFEDGILTIIIPKNENVNVKSTSVEIK